MSDTLPAPTIAALNAARRKRQERPSIILKPDLSFAINRARQLEPDRAKRFLLNVVEAMDA